MKNIRYIIATIAFALAGSAAAQNLNSAYFLDGYAYGHELNPAKDYDRTGYVSMPLLGNVNFGMGGNISAADVLKFNSDGQLATIFSPKITTDEALSGLSSMNKTMMDLRLEIVSFGFHKWGGFNTFNLSTRSQVGISLPKSVAEFAKSASNQDYDISGIGMRTQAWIEMGFGHSRNIGKAWRVGGKVKILLGGGRADATVNNAHLNLTAPDKWVLTGDIDMNTSVKGLQFGSKSETIRTPQGQKDIQKLDFGSAKINKPGVNGGGLAFDLGGEWEPYKQSWAREWMKGIKVSAALLDLGFIHWSDNLHSVNASDSVIINGYNNVQVKDGPGVAFKDQSDRYSELLKGLTSLQTTDSCGRTTSLAATLNIGLEYTLPQYNRLKFGFLSTTRIYGRYSWNEERFSATCSPLKWLEGSINLGVGTLGTSFGWVLNIHPKGFNLFMGMDHTFGTLSKQGIPLKASNDFSIGINFPFGRSTIKSKKFPGQKDI